MKGQRWNVRFAPPAVRDKYNIPRGEAAVFRDAIAVLYEGPQPAGAQPVPGALNTYVYVRNGYVIAYETQPATRTNRILYFDRE